MCGCEKHQDDSKPCDCICDAHENFEAARDLAMRRHDAIVELEAENEQLQHERDGARKRAEAAEQRLRAIESIVEGGIGSVASGQAPPPLFDHLAQ